MYRQLWTDSVKILHAINNLQSTVQVLMVLNPPLVAMTEQFSFKYSTFIYTCYIRVLEKLCRLLSQPMHKYVFVVVLEMRQFCFIVITVIVMCVSQTTYRRWTNRGRRQASETIRSLHRFARGVAQRYFLITSAGIRARHNIFKRFMIGRFSIHSSLTYNRT